MDILERRARADALPTREVRTVRILELRKTGDDGLNFVGFASTTEQSYDMGWYQEVVRTGAFNKTIQEADDVRLLVNHDGIPLARTKSGTLKLREIVNPADDPTGTGTTGLWTDATLAGGSPLVETVRSAMDRGDLDEMSFAFQVTRQTWSPDYDQRDIQEVRLFDVSVVTYPANPTTSAKLRGLDMLADLDEQDARAMLAHLTKRFAPAPTPTLDRLRELAAAL